MPRRRPWLRRLGFLVGLVLALVGASAIVRELSGGTLGLSLGPVVGVVELSGVISDAETACESLAALAKDAQVVSVVLRIDSPGGGVAPSQEIYEEVARVREAKPVIASLGNVAASGGYYVASAATTIVADAGTLTGSIGVIMEFRQLQGLAEKVGVGENVVKSGPYKDIGHPLRPMTPAERALLQGMVDDVYGQFVEAVATGAGSRPTRCGRSRTAGCNSGAQAKAAGLSTSSWLNAAVRLAWERGGQTGEPRVRRVKGAWRPWWLELLGSLTPARQGLGGGLLFLYGGPTPQ
jgi:protease-4